MKLLKTIITILLLSSPAMADKDYDFKDLCAKAFTQHNIEFDRVSKFFNLYQAVEENGWFDNSKGTCRPGKDYLEMEKMTSELELIPLPKVRYTPIPEPKSWNWSRILIALFIICAFFARSDSQRARDNWVSHWANK